MRPPPIDQRVSIVLGTSRSSLLVEHLTQPVREHLAITHVRNFLHVLIVTITEGRSHLITFSELIPAQRNDQRTIGRHIIFEHSFTFLCRYQSRYFLRALFHSRFVIVKRDLRFRTTHRDFLHRILLLKDSMCS